jgi:predicted DNA-binding transcriptional regulator AlpA
MEDRLSLRPNEAAKCPGISPRKLFELTKNGTVPHIKLGTAQRAIVLYRLADLDAWLASKTTSQEVSQ